jgi:hypothetical protein
MIAFKSQDKTINILMNRSGQEVAVSAHDKPPNQGRYAEANGLSIYYEEFGSGEPLVLLHRGFATGRIWQPHISLFAKHYRVIVPDSRGQRYCQSHRPN